MKTTSVCLKIVFVNEPIDGLKVFDSKETFLLYS